MKNQRTLIMTLALLFAAQGAQAKLFKVELNGKQGVKFQLPYTAGTHTGLASLASGTVGISDVDGASVEFVNVQVPLDSITTGNKTRDCHMREAMGINYIGSDFPRDHVCDAGNQTPATGPNSVVYPNIDFKLTPNLAGELPILKVDETQAVALGISGLIKMHGIEKVLKSPNSETINLKISRIPNSQNLRITATFEIVLADFDIQVKPFKLGPIEIGVGEKAKVSLDLVLVPVP